MHRTLRRLILSFAALILLGALVVLGARVPRVLRAARICPQSSDAPASPAGPLPPSAITGLLLVANQKSASASIVDLATGAVTHFPTGEEPHEAAVSPDGRWGVVSDYGLKLDGNKLFVIDMAAKRVTRVIDLGEYRGAHDLTFLPGSSTRVVVTTQVSQHAVEVDLEKGVVAAIETKAPESHTLALARDGRTLFTANDAPGNLSRLDLARRAFVRHYPVGPRPEGLAITPDGREVWAGSRDGDGWVRVLDVATGKLLGEMSGFGNADRVAMSRDGRRAVIPDWGCDVLHVADVPSRRIVGVITGLGDPHGVEIAPDNRVAFVTLGSENVVAIVDLETRRVLARHAVQDGADGLGWGPAPR